ncbi:MAG: hypothetical protein QM664_07905 [Flavihumibacter sp.]
MKAAIPVLLVLFAVLSAHHAVVDNNRCRGCFPVFSGTAPNSGVQPFYTAKKTGHKRHIPASNDTNNGCEPAKNDNNDSPGTDGSAFQPPPAGAHPVLAYGLPRSGFPPSHYLVNNRHIALCVFLL